MSLKEEKRKRAAAKGRFTCKVNAFLAAHSDAAPVSVLNGIYEEVERVFESVEKCNEYIIDLVYEEEDGDLIKEAEDYISQLEVSRTKIKVDLEKAKLAQSPMIQGNAAPIGNISVKKIDPPTFSGNMREYPNFRDDYERLVVPKYGQDPYVLRQCLSGEALHSVKGLENDYVAMRERLNQKYGNHRKVIDLIIGDLRAMKQLSDGDDRGFLKMVKTVESCYLDLKRMSLKSEMNSTNIFSLVEKVMPPTQKREWIAEMDKDTVKNGNVCSLDLKCCWSICRPRGG